MSHHVGFDPKTTSSWFGLCIKRFEFEYLRTESALSGANKWTHTSVSVFKRLLDLLKRVQVRAGLTLTLPTKTGGAVGKL